MQVWDASARAWAPFASKDKVLFELTLIDPFIRAPFALADAKTGLYRARHTMPDSFGVYKWRTTVDQFRGAAAGLTFIQHDVTVPVRPFAHNEYPRFLLAAYPYYASAGAVMAAFVLFCAAFLLTKDAPLQAAAAVAGGKVVKKAD